MIFKCILLGEMPIFTFQRVGFFKLKLLHFCQDSTRAKTHLKTI